MFCTKKSKQKFIHIFLILKSMFLHKQYSIVPIKDKRKNRCCENVQQIPPSNVNIDINRIVKKPIEPELYKSNSKTLQLFSKCSFHPSSSVLKWPFSSSPTCICIKICIKHVHLHWSISEYVCILHSFGI